MSKASEWAERSLREKPRFIVRGRGEMFTLAQVAVLAGPGVYEPNLMLERTATLNTTDALAFARWILDTFGEPPAPTGARP